MFSLVYQNSLSPCLNLLLVAILTITWFVMRFRRKTRESSSSEEKTKPNEQLPYSCFGHPHKSLIDKSFGLIMAKFFPLATMAKHICSVDSSERIEDDDLIRTMLQTLGGFREKSRKTDASAVQPLCRKMNKIIMSHSPDGQQDSLIAGTVLIPRNNKILSKWNICAFVEPGSEEQEMVEVELLCAASMIKNQLEFEECNKKSKNKYKKFKSCALETLQFAPEAEIMFNFHPGGMILGNPNDSLFVGLLIDAMKIQLERNDHCSQSAKKLVIMSINYRLSPEHPFPSPIIDGLSVIDSTVDRLPKAKFHISGISAGANLAIVTCFECVRYYKGSVKLMSTLACDPMLLPHTNTQSYHLNSKHSPFCPVDFLRWAWGAYLGFDCKKYRETCSKDIDFCSFDSYTTAFSQSKWMVDNSDTVSMRRLITPQTDIPTEFFDEGSPQLILTSSSACPLRCDSLDLIQNLLYHNDEKLPANVFHFEGFGSHCVSLMLDRKCREKILKTWHSTIWS